MQSEQAPVQAALVNAGTKQAISAEVITEEPLYVSLNIFFTAEIDYYWCVHC